MLRDIVGLSRRESKPKQEAPRICAEVDFGAESASALAEGLRGLPLPFFGTRYTGMSTHDSAINDQTRQIWITRKMLVHAFPHIMLAPARKAFIDRVPLPVLRGPTTDH